MGDRQIIARSFIREMLLPSAANAYMGLSIWRGWRGEGSQSSATGNLLMIAQASPFDSEVYYLLGGSAMALWIVPAADLVVLRWGDDPPDWQPEYIVNRLLRDLAPARPAKSGSMATDVVSSN